PYLEKAVIAAREFDKKFSGPTGCLIYIAKNYAKFRLFNDAKKLADTIEPPQQKAEALYLIATELRDFNYEVAFELICQAEDICETSSDQFIRVKMLLWYTNFKTERLEKKRTIDKALSSLRAVKGTDATRYDNYLNVLSLEYANLGFYDEAVNTFREIKELSYPEMDISLMYQLVSAGEYNKALSLLQDYHTDIQEREKRLLIVVDFMLQNGDEADAWKLFEMAETPKGKALLLATFGESRQSYNQK
ncbi:MAG: hypothetical protein ACRC2T_12240, partial [Thermoguttaceae bacterium]